MTDAPPIRIENLHKSFRELEVPKRIELSVASGAAI